MTSYIKGKLIRSVDRALVDISPYISALLCFLTIYTFEGADNLSAAKIIGVLQIAITLSGLNKQFSLAVSVYFQINIVMDRFVSIMNQKDVRLQILKGENEPKTATAQQGEIQFIDFYGYWKEN